MPFNSSYEDINFIFFLAVKFRDGSSDRSEFIWQLWYNNIVNAYLFVNICIH